ncbi:Pyridoxal 4-dehydrogenase [Microbacterium oxydans]|uniref:Pyridoxal 4-dehydrogenase n=1 Tax=Microbacterium oxydans TaxID=82380 RepID=A0A0F0KS83_9MICO|nr:aldo/keto reductase [Microbacterium oxydans]KJL22990.1 Pyridoxal 4-dehydrogenase [Microbacterium oxydans]
MTWITDSVAVGHHGLTLPRVGLGTASLGNFLGSISDQQASDTVADAFDAGVRYFDTAPLYGHGLAERRLSAGLGAHRAEAVISTKVGRLLRAGAPRDESQYVDGEPFYTDVPDIGPLWDFSYEGVRTSLEESLERLDVEHVDILNLHDPDEHFDAASTSAYHALRDLRAEGAVKGIGAGMNQTRVLTRLVETCDLDVVLLAGRYTLLDQSSMADVLPACRRRGTSVIAGGVFNSGVLLDPSEGARFDYVPADSHVLQKARAIRDVCDRYDIPLGAAAIQFPLAHPQVGSLLIGARSAEEFRMDVDLLTTPIPGAFWHDLRTSGLIPEDVPTPEGA